MAQIHHFDHGWITPTLSYVLSVLGSMLGLTCAVRLRAARGRGERIWWLILASISIGGTAIWSMHFVAMMGFSVVGTQIRYDVGLTVASALIAIVAVSIGVAIAAFGKGHLNLRVLIGGIIAGLGVAAMHYTGMAAMKLNGDISYSVTRVGLSVGIAVVAATVALWLAMTVRKPLVIFFSALVMGVAVNGMHFTGMSAMSVMEHNPTGALSGASASSMLVPIGLGVVVRPDRPGLRADGGPERRGSRGRRLPGRPPRGRGRGGSPAAHRRVRYAPAARRAARPHAERQLDLPRPLLPVKKPGEKTR